MKFNLKTFPCKNCTDACYCEDPKEWIKEFEKELRQEMPKIDQNQDFELGVKAIIKEIFGE